LKEQDQDGIDAELLFASEARNPAIPDKAAFLAIVQGFNDYFIEEYCGVAPHRLDGRPPSGPISASTKTSLK
jgi:hypothetical protein